MAKELKPDTPILLMQEEAAEKNDLKVVKGLDKKGNPKGVDPNKSKPGDFLSIDKGSDLIENFFRNFLKQANAPKHMGLTRNVYKFYIVTYGMLKDAVNMTSEQLDKFRVKPEDYINKKQAEIKAEVDKQPEQKTGEETKIDKSQEATAKQEETNDRPKEESKQKEENKQLDVSRIPHSEFDKLGISPESIEKYIKQMSWGFKSNDLVDINLKVGDTEIPVKARLSLTEQPDGSINFKMHPYQSKLDLEKPFLGIKLPEEVKKNLAETGHGGQVVNLEPEPGRIVPSLISIDTLTNRLEAVPVESLSFKKILGVELKPEQEYALKRGEKVHIDNMTSKKTGTVFNDDVQFNAARGLLDFSKFAPKIKQDQSQEHKELKPRKIGEVWVRPIQGGVQLTKEQFEKVCKGEGVYISNMERKPPKQDKEGAHKVEATDKKGHKYNAWVYIDSDKGYVKHSSKLPNHIKPAQGYEAQVAVNNKGKTNEATKYVQEPLKKGQTHPTERQAQQMDQEKKKVVKKNKGVSM